MIIAFLVVALASLAFAAVGPVLGRRLAPALATRLLAIASAAVAGLTMSAMAVVGFSWLAEVPRVAAYGDWSAEIVRSTNPVPLVVRFGSVLLLTIAVARAGVVVVHRVRAGAAARRTYGRHAGPGRLIVVDAPVSEAFATPVAGGRIVVTTALLKALSADERRVLLAHEESHLINRHSWWLLAAELSAVVNPLFASTARGVAHAAERWADEDAATDVGDRHLVARTIAQAALHVRDSRRAGERTRLAAVGGALPERIRALLEPPPRRRVLPAAILLSLVVISACAMVILQLRTDVLLDNASRLTACGDQDRVRHETGEQAYQQAPRGPLLGGQSSSHRKQLDDDVQDRAGGEREKHDADGVVDEPLANQCAH
jgi:Zn-dependent protease with chaperone function